MLLGLLIDDRERRMSVEEWWGGCYGSGGSKGWLWWMVGSNSGGLWCGWGKEKEKEEGEENNLCWNNKDIIIMGMGFVVGMSMWCVVGVWVVFLIVVLLLVMLVNNVSLIGE